MSARQSLRPWALALGALMIALSPRTALAKPTASEILNKVRATYAGVASYSDKGLVDTIYYDLKSGKKTNREQKPFETEFDRAKLLKFEYAEQTLSGLKDRFVIFSDFNKTSSYSELTKETNSGKSLETALGAAAEVSEGSSWLVPALLLSLSGTCSVLNLDLAAVKGSEDIAGRGCYKLSGKECDGEKVTLWVDSKLFLLRKIERTRIFDKKSNEESKRLLAERLKDPEFVRSLHQGTLEILKKETSSGFEFREFRTKTVFSYNPRIGVKIDPKKVIFDPNKSANE